MANGAEVRLPKYTREVLPNGAVVYLMPKPAYRCELPGAGEGGIESEPMGSPAVLSDRAVAANRYVAAHRYRILKRLDGLGGTFMASSNEQYTLVASEFLKKDFAAGLDLTADALLHASFRERGKESPGARRGRTRAQKDNPQPPLPILPRIFLRPVIPMATPR